MLHEYIQHTTVLLFGHHVANTPWLDINGLLWYVSLYIILPIFLTILPSPHAALFPPAPGSVFPVPELQWFLDCKQILPSHGYGLRGDDVHHTPGNLPRGYQRDRAARRAVGQLGGDSL